MNYPQAMSLGLNSVFDILSLDEVCVVRFSPTSIFIVTPSLGGLPAKAKESLPPIRQTIPAGCQPSTSWSQGELTGTTPCSRVTLR